MKKVRKLLCIVLSLLMVLCVFPVTSQAADPPYMISAGGTLYLTLSETLANASDGAIITLTDNITESVTYAATAGKTITIDGGGFTMTAPNSATESTALSLSGTGTVKLKDLTLQGGTAIVSKGLEVSGSVNVESEGTVAANGAECAESYGLINNGSGTANVTTVCASAYAGGFAFGYGVYNAGSGTVNVSTATVLKSVMGGDGVYNKTSGTVNVGRAEGPNTPGGDGVHNAGTGTVNAGIAAGNAGVFNSGMGTVNAGTLNGTILGTGTVNTGTSVAAITLNKGAGAVCVLDSITVAAATSTAIGILPAVYKNGVAGVWYPNTNKAPGSEAPSNTPFTAPGGSGVLYSSFCYSISGKIYDNDTKTGLSASLQLKDSAGSNVVSAVTADASGAYVITNVPLGSNYTIEITRTGYVAKTIPAFNMTADITSPDYFINKQTTSSGGSGGGGGGGTVAATGATTTTSNGNATIATVATTATTGANGSAAATVTGTQVTDAIDKAVKGAAAQGTGTEALVEIKVEGAGSATSVSTTIPQSSFTELSGSSADGVRISTPLAAVTFDAAALDAIKGKAAGDIKITVALANTSGLTSAEKEAVGGRPVYDLTVASGSTTISDFGGGSATVSLPYKPAAGEDAGKIVIYYLSDSGELVMIQNCSYDAATGKVTFIAKHFSNYVIGYNNVSFSDVSGWCKDYVNYLAAREIISGTGNGTFNPNTNITRAQFVTILANLSGADLSGYTTSSFNDVSKTAWYSAAVQWAYAEGIATGAGGKFDPNANITRQDMAVMIMRYAEKAADYTLPATNKAITFTDSKDIGSYASGAVTAMQQAGIIGGNSDGSFAPASNASRAQAAKMIALLQQGMMK